MYWIWILESRLILSNNPSNATLSVLVTYLILGLRPFIIILIQSAWPEQHNSWVRNRATHMGTKKCRTRWAHLPNTLVGAWHRAPFVNCHVFLRGWPCGFLVWMATWFYFWSYGLFFFLTNGRRFFFISRCATNLALTSKRWIRTSWWQLWSVWLIPRVSWGISNAPCTRLCHSVSELGGLMMPHTSDHSPGKFVLANVSWRSCRAAVRYLIDVAMRHTIEVTSHHVNVFLMHYSTDCK